MTYLLWLLGVTVQQIVVALPYYTAIKSSESFIRRHGPMVVSNQYECALACSCASGLLSNNDCNVFNDSLPGVNCVAYSYNFNSRQCALLGEPSTNMCSEPVIVYELGNSTRRNPKCGPTTLDEQVICDSDGYKCPIGFLPYLFFDMGTPSYRGGNLIYFNGTSYILSYLDDSTFEYSTSMVHNITCKPASAHSFDACKTPRLTNALTLKDTFGCLPGFEYESFMRWDPTFAYNVKTVPVCTIDGWAEKAGGKLVVGKLVDVKCKKIV